MERAGRPDGDIVLAARQGHRAAMPLADGHCLRRATVKIIKPEQEIVPAFLLQKGDLSILISGDC